VNAPAGDAVFQNTLSPSMRAVEIIIHELAHSDVPVLLLGESGAGKRTIARRIHDISPQRTKEFRILCCADLNAEHFQEIESGFTSGTVFLEEVGDLAGPIQTKLMQRLSVSRADGVEQSRLICGSARDLGSEVRAGRLREDLFYQISGVCLPLPPLRQRKEDIPGLTKFFLEKFASDFGRPVPNVSPETQQLFSDYGWPGNIPELADAVKALVALGNESLAMRGLRAMLTNSQPQAENPRVSLKDAARAASRDAERELILRALTRTRWNRRRAAQDLQISYKALLYKLKQIGYSEYEAS
jgi:two-component system, NtrC family, response regulator AtoC